MTKTSRLSQEQQNDIPPQEVSRWSKTTTESEASEALPPYQSAAPASSPPPAKKTNVLKKKIKQRKLSKDSTASSPVDPSYDPKTRKLGLPGQEQPSITPSPVVEPITGPDEPRSFYESGSDESSDGEPILQRASSVRVAKPFIVQHNNGSGGSVPTLYASQQTPTGDESLVPKPLSLGHQLMNVNTLSTDDEEVSKETNKQTGGPKDALQALEGHRPGLESLSSVPEALSEESTSPRDTLKKTILEYADPVAGDEGMDTLPTPMGGFGSLRIGKMGSDAGESSNTYVGSSLDGLRSNPITAFDKKLSRAISAPVRQPVRRVTIRPSDLVISHGNDHRLLRETIVSTPYPARQNSMVEFEDQPAPEVVTPNRRLRRSKPLPTSDKDLKSTDSKSKNKEVDEPAESTQEKDQPPRIPLSTKPTISSSAGGLVTARSDRFPSPVAPEILFLDLRLARHPSARVTVEVEIINKATFDDEQLFTIIQKTYSTNLLGVVRGLLSARHLSHASLTSVAGNDDINIHRRSNPNTATWYGHSQNLATGPIDGVDFARHLLNPSLGHRRKIWLLWLRNQQYTGHANRQHRAARGVSQQPSPLDDSESPIAFSFMHPRNNSHSLSLSLNLSPSVGLGQGNNSDISPTMATVAPSTASNGGGGVSRQVSMAASHAHSDSRPSITIPRMPFQPFQPFHARDKSTAASTTASSISTRKNSTSLTTTGPPALLYLHYTFSLRRILALLTLTLIAALFTTTMWILFGVPGRSIRQGDGIGRGEYGGEVQAYWREDAHRRVGVGLLLGFVVVVLGVVFEGVWVWGSWVLL